MTVAKDNLKLKEKERKTIEKENKKESIKTTTNV